MKILALSDLHINSIVRFQEYKRWIRTLALGLKPDVIVITGDVFESNYVCNHYEQLAELAGRRKVIFTLGNHEFFDRTPAETLRVYRSNYNPNQYDVHCLDVINELDVNGVHFFGNVLWYDGSMATIQNQDMSTFANGTWADKYIVDFDWLKESNKYSEQIRWHSGDSSSTKILCTHCAPHRLLNGWMSEKDSPYNAFSGFNNFLGDVDTDYVLCGHTHWRQVEVKILDAVCTNIGNDYAPPYQYYLLEV